MPDSTDLRIAIGEALRTFAWDDFGYDDIGIDITDPCLDIAGHLTHHLVKAVEKLLED